MIYLCSASGRAINITAGGAAVEVTNKETQRRDDYVVARRKTVMSGQVAINDQ